MTVRTFWSRFQQFITILGWVEGKNALSHLTVQSNFMQIPSASNCWQVIQVIDVHEGTSNAGVLPFIFAVSILKEALHRAKPSRKWDTHDLYQPIHMTTAWP